jgi:heat shock protein HtpX
MNYFKTFALLVGMAALLMIVGHLIGGPTGVIVALILAIILNFTSWYYSDKIVLSMYRAQEVDESGAPNLYAIVRDLARDGNLPMPKVYVVPTSSPNAFATGRDPNHAAVAATQGLLGLLSHDELKAVLAHEMAHVKNRDSLVMTVAATLAAAIGLLAYFARWAAFFGAGDRRGGGGLIALLVWSIIAPIIAMIIQLAISRTREYGADRGGAEITAQPLMLASALRKISDYSSVRPQQDLADPSTAHMWIASPFSGGLIASLFSTHPPVEERIRRLEKMASR